MRRILFLIIFLIVYGSLYPWHFVVRQPAENPFRVLLHSWNSHFDRFAVRDAIVNIALYIPLGMSAHFVFRKVRVPLLGIYGPVLLGLILSASMEMMQVFTPLRITSMVDLLTNVTGAAAGVALALLTERITGPVEMKIPRLQAADRGALILLFFWIGSLLFPFFPRVGLYQPAQSLRVLMSATSFDPVQSISAAASWFAAGRLLDAAGARHTRILLGVAILAIPAQLFIVDRQPRSADLAGAVAGFLLFLAVGRLQKARLPGAIAFLLVLLLRGFAPFHFTNDSREFSLVPFSGFLQTDWQNGLLQLLQKSFFYGTAVWLLRAGGMRLLHAVALTASVLLAIEVAQTSLPGRTPEITDPLLAILIGFGLRIYRVV